MGFSFLTHFFFFGREEEHINAYLSFHLDGGEDYLGGPGSG